MHSLLAGPPTFATDAEGRGWRGGEGGGHNVIK